MDRTTWIGVRWWRDSGNVTAGYQVAVTVDDGSEITNLARIEGLEHLGDLVVVGLAAQRLEGRTFAFVFHQVAERGAVTWKALQGAKAEMVVQVDAKSAEESLEGLGDAAEDAGDGARQLHAALCV